MQPIPLLLGHCPQVTEIRRLARAVAKSTTPALITGESGTGKQMVARFIHALSPRVHRPFITISCASLPLSLIELELFGYVKGAFADAQSTKIGLLQLADGGTVLLDKVDELPRAIQPKILRVLQEQSIRKVGTTQSEKISVRFLATASPALTPDDNGFRKDLYIRLAGFVIAVPPLRERRGDIAELAREFLRHEPGAKNISSDALQRLKEHTWPGNVRELQGCCHRLALRANDDEVTVEDVENCLAQAQSRLAETLNIEQLEQDAIERALELTEGDVAEASRLVGIARTTFYRKLKQYRTARMQIHRSAATAAN